MGTTYIKPISVEKNGVFQPTTDIMIKRGEAAGTVYPIAQVQIAYNADKSVNIDATIANLVDYATWRGPASVVKAVNSLEKQDGQTALDAAVPESAWKQREVASIEDPAKTTKVWYYDDVNEELYWKYYLSDTMRGGVTKADLKEEFDSAQAECRSLFAEMVKPDTSIDRRNGIQSEIAKLISDIQGLEQAIANRSREPRAKKTSVVA